MNWNIDDAAVALAAELPEGAQEGAVSLPLYDRESGIGIGVDGLGAGTLVLPGQQSLVAFETTALKFDPWCDTTWVEGAMALPKSAVLRCRFDREDEHLIRLVAGLLVSLVDLQTRYDDAGKAIWTLRELFGEGFHAEPEQSAVLGLLGVVCRGTVLSKDVVTSPSNRVHPRLDNIIHDLQVLVSIDFEAFGKEKRWHDVTLV